MALTLATPWHKASFDSFCDEWLPGFLAARLPLIGYQRVSSGPYSCRISLTLASSANDITIEYRDLPQPDEAGLFEIDGEPYVVVPYAASDDLANSEIYCVGEQLMHYCEKRLAYQAPLELTWTEELVRSWLPLDTWLREFFKPTQEDSEPFLAQHLDRTNWLAAQQHLRRIFIKNRTHLFTPGHFGRTCPFETPEGPNIARMLHIALGAEIRDQKLVVVDEQPAAALGLSAAMIPLLEHNDPRRLLMGTNMMRQWLTPATAEPALVQSGNEPAVPRFWCGRNLLTAFISWGADTFEDGIVISESCARRLNYPHSVEPGDKLSNRHGTKGVVSRILPDEEMPHLADGTPVELVYNFISLHSRLYFGQVREALLSRIARTEGTAFIAPPFGAPDETQIRERLAHLGLPEDGMETLLQGRDGQPLAQPSTVGWVYWGRLVHVAREKLRTSSRDGVGMLQGELEYYALRDAGAFENIQEHFNTLAVERDQYGDHTTLAERIATGSQAGPPTPAFAALTQRLAALGIQAELVENEVTFRLSPPPAPTLTLARPIPHPWLHDQQLTEIGAYDVYKGLPTFQALVAVNTRLERMLASGAPESLVLPAYSRLVACAQAFCAALLPLARVRFGARTLSSARAVVTPAANLHYDQIGVAEEIAWDLFGLFVAREVGEEEVRVRSERATQALDQLLARSWVIVNRAPSLAPQAFVACHPVRDPARVIRLHPLVSRLIGADFDGDQAALYLPITPAAQREAGERLSLAAHLARNPGLLKSLLPCNEALWGLANLSLSEAGRDELSTITGATLSSAGGILTRDVLLRTLQEVVQRDGIAATLTVIERLLQRGFAVAQSSGASLSPFVGTHIALPAMPEGEEREAWNMYMEELTEQFVTREDYAQPAAMGPQLLAIKSGAWGEIEQLAWLVVSQGLTTDITGQPVAIRHGYCTGLKATELFALAPHAREVFAEALHEMEQLERDVLDRNAARSFHVLARASRAEHPGIVFAHAASIGERDPLSDRDSRLFVGLV